MIFIGTFKNKDLDFGSDFNKARLRDYASKHEDKAFRLETIKNPVSEKMRRWYFGAIIPTIQATVTHWETLDENDIHEMLKKMFNYFEAYNPLTKRTERYGRSAFGSDSNTSRAMDYIERLRVWMAEEFGVELPSPEEYIKLRDNPPLL